MSGSLAILCKREGLAEEEGGGVDINTLKMYKKIYYIFDFLRNYSITI
jgi:hypothetical protein